MTAGAERTRRWRGRRNRGVLMQASVEVTDEVLRALMTDGRLGYSEDGATRRVRRGDVSQAIGGLLADWVEQIAR